MRKADDFVQAALIKLHRAWPRVSRTDRPISYARRTLLRCWLDEKRRPWRRAEQRGGVLPERVDDRADPARAAEADDLRAERTTACGAV